MNLHRTWHQRHEAALNFGQKLADRVANGMGSWRFIILQTAFVALWMILNLIAFKAHWDPYPFILLNLLFSTQAAYAAPIIMMSQNRQNQRDRAQSLADYETHIEAKKEIESLVVLLNKIEAEKLNKIVDMLEAMQEKQ